MTLNTNVTGALYKNVFMCLNKLSAGLIVVNKAVQYAIHPRQLSALLMNGLQITPIESKLFPVHQSVYGAHAVYRLVNCLFH